MKTHLLILCAGAAGAVFSSPANAQEIQRTDLIKEDISVTGKEVVQVRVDIDPGATANNHKHPGEEIAYVLGGSLQYRLEGRDPVTLKAGDSLFIPSGVRHSAKNVGDGKASELATYIVTKGQILVVPVE